MRKEWKYASLFVVINADDFGRSEKINHAIIRAHTRGVLTSASLMVGEPFSDHAISLACRHPALGVGLHLTLSEGVPVLDRRHVAPLLTPNGRLSPNLFTAGLRYTFSKTAQKAISTEMEAQFARFAERGLARSHVDGHQHFHMHPFLWDKMLELCVQYDFSCVRVPREELRAHFRSGRRAITLDTVEAIFFRVLAQRNLKKLYAHGFFVCDRVYGMLQTGKMTANYTLALLERLKGHTNEIYFHPGSDYAAKLPKDQQNNGMDDVEYAALLDPRLKDKLREFNIARGTYAEIRQWASQVSAHTPEARSPR